MKSLNIYKKILWYFLLKTFSLLRPWLQYSVIGIKYFDFIYSQKQIFHTLFWYMGSSELIKSLLWSSLKVIIHYDKMGWDSTESTTQHNNFFCGHVINVFREGRGKYEKATLGKVSIFLFLTRQGRNRTKKGQWVTICIG